MSSSSANGFFFLYSDFMNQVADKKIEITSQDLPSFLYETGTVYDPENETIGLFRGFLLLRVSTDLISLISRTIYDVRSFGTFLRVLLQQ